jgi:hypothetical protein
LYHSNASGGSDTLRARLIRAERVIHLQPRIIRREHYQAAIVHVDHAGFGR